LGFSKYTHFTSPIRRYSDLTLHRILKAILRREKRQLEYLLREVGPLTDHLSKVEREVQKVEWDFYDRKFARWAQKRIGESFIGIVEDSDPPPIVRLEDSEIVGARVFVESLKEYPLFQRVRVKITRVDLPAAKIYGEVLEELDLPYHPTSAPGGEREGDGE
jgi:ribonuclease R